MRAFYEEVISKTAVAPQDAAAGAINGSEIDTAGYDHVMLIVEVGAASGSPTAQTVDAKLQDTATSGSGHADISGATMTQITLDNKQGTIKLNLSGKKRFVKAVVTPGFTGGTSPKIEVCGSFVLGKEKYQPSA